MLKYFGKGRATNSVPSLPRQIVGGQEDTRHTRNDIKANCVEDNILSLNKLRSEVCNELSCVSVESLTGLLPGNYLVDRLQNRTCQVLEQWRSWLWCEIFEVKGATARLTILQALHTLPMCRTYRNPLRFLTPRTPSCSKESRNSGVRASLKVRWCHEDGSWRAADGRTIVQDKVTKCDR